jgi:hypothetical protein
MTTHLHTYASDIPLSLAVRAHEGTSFSPEKRGQSEVEEYAWMLESDWKALSAEAEKGKTVGLLDAEFTRYREGLRKRFIAMLQSKARCMSTMIAGPAKFPVARNKKRLDIAVRRSTELSAFRESAIKAITRTLRPDLAPIMAGDADALERLEQEFAEAVQEHARMKAGNAALRKHHGDKSAQKAALIALGFSAAVTEGVLSSDWQGFYLVNRNANIKRLKERIEKISAAKAKPISEHQGRNARIEDDPPANRIRLIFAGKPTDDVRARLKRNGFRWAPSVGAWQAYRNSRSMTAAKEIAG